MSRHRVRLSLDAVEDLKRLQAFPSGNAGYVALFQIDGPSHVTTLAVRHQREEDYH